MNQGHWQGGNMDHAVEFSSANEQLEYGQEMGMEDVGENMDTDSDSPLKRKSKPWEKIGPDGKPIKRRPNLARRNMLLRKNLTPKNSVMCLNELKPGLKFVCERVATVGNYTVSVEVNGHTFSGYGSSKDQAKQAAAEAALMSFVKPPPPKPPVGEAPKPEDDATPWKTLASFAMYKLFTDWRDNKFGPGPHCYPPMTSAMSSMMMGAAASQVPPVKKEDLLESFQNINAHLNRTTAAPPAEGSIDGDGKPVGVPDGSSLDQAENSNMLKPVSFKKDEKIKENKMNPEHQATRHPVMILHQMCPQISYTCVERQDVAGLKCFELSAEINGQTFTGTGTAVKKAKILLAKTALKQLYGIDNVYPTA